MLGYAYGQDILVDINGTEARGKLVGITETHVVFVPEGSRAPIELQMDNVSTVIQSDGTIVYGGVSSYRKLAVEMRSDTVLILRKGKESRFIQRGRRVEFRGNRWRSLGQGRLVAASDSTLTILGLHSNIIDISDIARMTVLSSQSRHAHLTRGERTYAVIVSGFVLIFLGDQLIGPTRDRVKGISEGIIAFVIYTAPVWWSRIPPTRHYKIGPEEWQVEVLRSE